MNPTRHVPTGDGKSIDTLTRSYFGRVYSFCRTLLGNDADAEDACQSVFLTVARKREELEAVERPAPWLLQIARLTCLNARRERDRSRTEAVESEGPVDVGPPLAPSEDLDRIRDGVARLPERYRSVLALHFQQGLSHAEMAQALGMSRGALRVLLHRAVTRLREEVKTR